ncbi:MAG: TetR family transcriptional regulator [Polyangiaceae bacterium]|nr:TetR family transcriptional regulator [Polyangiaceae bacterium]
MAEKKSQGANALNHLASVNTDTAVDGGAQIADGPQVELQAHESLESSSQSGPVSTSPTSAVPSGIRTTPLGARPSEAAHESLGSLTRKKEESGERIRPGALGAELAHLPSSDEFNRSVNWQNRRVAAILQTAARCFAAGGFTATTLAEIGRELGLRKSIVHYYFASKTALVHEVQSYTASHFLDAIRSSLGPQETDSTTSGPIKAPADDRPDACLLRLFDQIMTDATLRSLSIEFWSEARRDAEVARRCTVLDERLESELQRYLAENGMSLEDAVPQAKELRIFLYGLITLAERDGYEQARAIFSAYLRKMH